MQANYNIPVFNVSVSFTDYCFSGVVVDVATNGGGSNWLSWTIQGVDAAYYAGIEKWAYNVFTDNGKIISQASKQFGKNISITSKTISGAGVLVSVIDMSTNGVNMENHLDLCMGVLGVVSGPVTIIYMAANGITILATGETIGAHLHQSVMEAAPHFGNFNKIATESTNRLGYSQSDLMVP